MNIELISERTILTFNTDRLVIKEKGLKALAETADSLHFGQTVNLQCWSIIFHLLLSSSMPKKFQKIFISWLPQNQFCAIFLSHQGVVALVS